MDLPSFLGMRFESMSISKINWDFECGVELPRDFKSDHLVRGYRKDGMKAS